jgi:effector-binding domain-containing protein
VARRLEIACMNRRTRHAVFAWAVAATLPLAASAQSPPANDAAQAPPAASAPSAPSEPPPPAAPESAPPAAPTAPPAAETPAAEPDQKIVTADPFGEEMTLAPRTVVMLKGNASWENAFEALTDSFKKLSSALAKQNIAPAGPFIVIYTSTDDAGFTYFTEIPVDQEPKDLPKGITIGKSPEGRVIKFVHRGSYDNMDNTYEAITNHLDKRYLEAKDMFIEEYVTDPLKTTEDKLVINVLVPLK